MKQRNQQLDQVVKGGLLLTLSSFISKLLSALYKVPFQNLTGDEGFYVYQQVYPIYGLAVAFTLTGLPLFVSKIVSEADNELVLEKRMQELHTWLVMIGLSLFLLLQVGAGLMAKQMGDAQLTPVIQSVSYFFLLLPFLALTRGYFQGQTNMIPTSLSQVIEQLIRVAILLGIALYFPRSSWSFYEMGANAYHSSWISAIFAGLVLFYFMKKEHLISSFIKSIKPRFSLKMGKRLLTEGFLIIIVGSLLILFQFVDSFTVYNGLLDSGFTNEQSMALKGIYDRGQPLIQLGMVVGISLSAASLPLLRKRVLADEWKEWRAESASILKMTLILSSAASVGLIAVMPWMNFTLFKDALGTEVLQVMMVNVVLVSLIYCIQAILQSTNQSNQSLFILLIGLAFKMMMNPLATRKIGIMGSAIVTVLSLLIIFIFMIQMTDRAIWKLVAQNKVILKLLVLLVGLYAVVFGSISFMGQAFSVVDRSGNLILTLLGVGLGVLFYGFCVMKWNLLNEQELNQLPIPNVLKRLNRK